MARSHEWQADTLGSVSKWCNIETSKGVFDWAYLDIFVNAHVAAGRKVLLTIDGTPAWAVASPLGQGGYFDPAGNRIPASSTCPDDINDFADWCTAVATRYGNNCVYEIWNEPNFAGGTAGFWVDTASNLARLMRVAYQAIKAVDPSLIVCSPSPTGPTDRLKTLLLADDGAGGRGADWFDVLGYHMYDSNLANVSVEASISRIVGIKSILRDLGKSDKPIWDTECGVDGGFAWATAAQRLSYIQQFWAVRWALGVYVNFFFAYDSTGMGMKVPESTGATYDMTPYYQDFYDFVIGKILVSSRIYRDDLFILRITLNFSDGSSITC